MKRRPGGAPAPDGGPGRPGARRSGPDADRGPAPAPLRLTALRVLDAVFHRAGNSSLLLEQARFASPQDRALATEVVLGTLRRRAALDHWIGALADRPLERIDPGVRAALRLGLYQLGFLDRVPAYAAVSETVAAAKRALGPRPAAFVNALLRGFERRRASLPLPGPEDAWGELTVTLGLPPFLARRWSERYGPATARELAVAAARPARVTLRALLSRTSRDDLAATLAAEGVETRPGAYLPSTLVVTSGSALSGRAAREGRFVVQDEAAGLVAALVDAGPGERVLDACAAPGGKAIAIADAAAVARQADGGGPRVQVIAADLRFGRLARLAATLKRVRVGGVRLVAMDAAGPALRAAGGAGADRGAGFDRILLDAPCTGTGTLRRNPEIRDRVDAVALDRSRLRSVALLAGVVPLLRPGGRLVYATCSLEPEENEAVIAAACAAHPELEPVDAAPLLPEAARGLVGADGVLRTHPGDPDVDGFTAAVLRRRR